MAALAPAEPLHDEDPLPRAAAVSPASPYAAVAAARPVQVRMIGLAEDAEELPPRRITPLRSWRFAVDKEPPAAVTVPDTWSRRDPGLADFRGPARYAREVPATGPYARLVFDGIDYLASIRVGDGAPLVHEGGFTPVAVDVPVGAPVTVTVDVDDPFEEGLDQPDPLMVPKRKIKGVFEQHDSRPGGLPLGDIDPLWARRWGTGGLTGQVWLHETGPVRIVACFVTATPGLLRVSWVLDNRAAETEVDLLLSVGGVTATLRAKLPAGPSRASARFVVEGLDAWTADRPVLHDLRTTVAVDGAPSDSYDVAVGFREVAMATEGDRKYHLELNGRPTYVRAANYIPGVWLPELSAETVRLDVELAKDAGLNSFGVHAHVCPPLFAEADRLGLLVYQDFPLQWFYDADAGPLVDGGPTYAEASLWLAAEMVYAHYNHPSVVYWCAHNEPAYQLAELFRSGGTQMINDVADHMASCPDEEELDRRRADLFTAIDPTRPAWTASGLGATRPGGDAHDYSGSLSGGYATGGRAGRTAFVSEFGAWAPNFSAAADTPGARGDWPPPPEAKRDWNERTHIFASQVAYAGLPERFADFQGWCFAAQLWAGWHAKVYSEACRLAKWDPMGGHRYHFFVDHWGSAGAGVVDRHRTAGPAYAGMAAGNRPLVALAPLPAGGRVRPGEPVSLPVVVLNDGHEDLGVRPLTWRLAALGPDDVFVVGRDHPGELGALEGSLSPVDQCAVIPRRPGQTLLENGLDVAVRADAREELTRVDWTPEDDGPVALFLDLGGITGWTAFMVAPDGWVPTPGLSGPDRFRVTSERPGVLRRRWTGEEVDPESAPPDQYLWDGRPLSVFDDVHVTHDGRVVAPPLPWDYR